MDERGTQTRSTTGLGRPRRRSPPSPPVAALAAGGHLCVMLARRMQQRVRRLQLPRRWSQLRCDGRSCGGEDHRTRALEDELTSEPRQGLNRRTPSVLQTLLKKLQPLDGKASTGTANQEEMQPLAQNASTLDEKSFNQRQAMKKSFIKAHVSTEAAIGVGGCCNWRRPMLQPAMVKLLPCSS